MNTEGSEDLAMEWLRFLQDKHLQHPEMLEELPEDFEVIPVDVRAGEYKSVTSPHGVGLLVGSKISPEAEKEQ
jgi:hypothetical protein